jgi:hypothetical protein
MGSRDQVEATGESSTLTEVILILKIRRFVKPKAPAKTKPFEKFRKFVPASHFKDEDEHDDEKDQPGAVRWFPSLARGRASRTSFLS